MSEDDYININDASPKQKSNDNNETSSHFYAWSCYIVEDFAIFSSTDAHKD